MSDNIDGSDLSSKRPTPIFRYLTSSNSDAGTRHDVSRVVMSVSRSERRLLHYIDIGEHVWLCGQYTDSECL